MTTKTTVSWSDRCTSLDHVATMWHDVACSLCLDIVWERITKQSDAAIDFCPIFSASVLGEIVWKCHRTATRCTTYFPAFYLDKFLLQSGQKNQWCLRSSVLHDGFYFCISHLHALPAPLTLSPSSCTNIYRWISRPNRVSFLIYKYWLDPSITPTHENPS